MKESRLSSVRSSSLVRVCLFAVVLTAAFASTASVASADWTTPTALSVLQYPEGTQSNGNPPLDVAPQVVSLSGGRATVVWTRQGTGFVFRNMQNGVPTSQPTVIVPQRDDLIYYMQAASIGGDNVVISYPRVEGARTRLVGRILNSVSGLIGPEITIGYGEANDLTPQNITYALLVKGPGTEASAIWVERDGDNYQIEVRSIDSSGSTGNVSDVGSPSAQYTGGVSIDARDDGSAALAWNSQISTGFYGQSQNYYAEMLSAGAVSAPIAVSNPESASMLGSPKVIANPASAMIVWSETAGWGYYWSIYYREPTIDGPGDARLLVSGTNGAYSGGPVVNAVANGDGTTTVVLSGQPWQLSSITQWYVVGGPNPPSGPWVLNNLPGPVTALIGNNNVSATVFTKGPSSTTSSVISAGGSHVDSVLTSGDGTNVGGAGVNVSRGPEGVLSASWNDWVPAPDWGTDYSGAPKQALGVSAAQTPYDAPATCPAVRVIGARGSDDTPELGTPVRKYFHVLSTELQNMGLSAESRFVDYPAVPAWDVFEYSPSVTIGEAALESLLTTESRRDDPCANVTKLVLAGYSQGADVIGNVIEKNYIPTNVKNRIADVVFFGDPKFRASNHRVVARSTFDQDSYGLLNARSPDAFDSLTQATRVQSYCRYKDPVCQRGTIDPGPHMHYQDVEASWAAWSTQRIVSRPQLKSDWAPTIDATLTMRSKEIFVKFAAHGPPSGVCQMTADLAVTDWLGIRWRTVSKAITRADESGNCIAAAPVRDPLGLGLHNSVTKSIQGDLNVTAVASGYAQKDSDLSKLLR